MKNLGKFLFVWMPPIIWAGMIFAASNFPVPLKMRPEIPFWDKILHFFGYIPLGFLVSRALWMSEAGSLKKNFFVLTLLLCFLYGASDEIHQLFVAGRQASAWDALFDIFGSFTGFIFFNIFKGKDG